MVYNTHSTAVAKMCCTLLGTLKSQPSFYCLESERNCSVADVCLHLQDLLCYQLPEHPNFYSELVGCMEEGAAGDSIYGHATVTVLFNQFDSLQMQRVVGNARCKKMLKSVSATFLYC